MRKIFTTKKRIVIAGATAAVVLGSGGAAFAYFAATGTGAGSAAVGGAGAWQVTQTNTSGGPLYPGSGTVVDTLTIKNTGNGDQKITGTTLAMASDTSSPALAETGTYPNLTRIAGCDSGWFNAAYDSATPDPTGTQLSAGQSIKVKVDVTMPTDPTDDQSNCENSNPDVLLTVN